MPEPAAPATSGRDGWLLARARAAYRRDTAAEARLHGGQVVEVDGLLVTATGLPNGGWNPVHLVSTPADPAAALAAAGVVRRRYGHPPSVATFAEADPYAPLAERLGLAVVNRPRQMVLELPGPALPPPPPELVVTEAVTPAQVLAHAEVQAEAFLMDLDLLVRYLAPMPLSGYARLLTGEVDGQAVASAMLVCDSSAPVPGDSSAPGNSAPVPGGPPAPVPGGPPAPVPGGPPAPVPGDAAGATASIYGVGTRVAARRHGYGAAITAHCLRLALASGADLVQLHPSGVAAGVYRSLGFRELPGSTVWLATTGT